MAVLLHHSLQTAFDVPPALPVSRFLFAVFLVSSASLAGEEPAAPFTVVVPWKTSGPDAPVELQPYKSQLLVGDDRPNRHEREELLDGIRRMSEITWGGRWNLQLAAAHPSPWPDERRFRRLQPEEFCGSGPASLDVCYCVHVQRRAAGLAIRVRAWEPLWNHHSPVVSDVVYDAREAPLRVLELCRELFRPQAIWERVDDYSARIVVQAAAIASPNPEFPILGESEVFTPWVIARKLDGVVQRQQTVPWTYFVAQSLEQGRGPVRVISGLRGPLSARPRGRIEYRAVAARPQWPQTWLECYAQSQPPRRLGAHRVEVTPIDVRSPSEPEAPPSPEVFITDRLGRTAIGADSGSMIWTAVYSGALKLARVPLVPGSVETARIDLPDDAIRLQAEGQLQLIQNELVNLVALRSIVMASARAAAKKNDWTTARDKVAAARKLNNPQHFLERIAGVRVPAIAAAMEKKDRTTEQRVIRMCEETAELVKHYLDEERVKLLQEEIDELEAADRQTRNDVLELRARPEDLPTVVQPPSNAPLKSATPPRTPPPPPPNRGGF